ncbi:MAG TPA: hypothetical protein VGJ58_03755, partial [Gaiellaceae bacterium]
MSIETIVELAFAVGVLVAAAALGAAFLGRVSRRTLVAIAAVLGAAAAAAWVGFAFELDRETA